MFVSAAASVAGAALTLLLFRLSASRRGGVPASADSVANRSSSAP
ncbi:hypothetical protein [Cohnella thermotolerans]|nr:hypothetical protein [Cohnella thermotolerans]